MHKRKFNTHDLVMVTLFTAIIVVLSQITIPLPLVPITGQTLAIGLAATILGAKRGTIAVFVYLLMGAIGLPVFAQMTGGVGRIFGPTGGFLISFLPMAAIIGYMIEKKGLSLKNAFIANLIGTLLSLTMGTIWLKWIAHLSWIGAFSAGFLPFIIVGIVKSYLAAWIGITILKRLPHRYLLHKRHELI